jgi:hypothetical protein
MRPVCVNGMHRRARILELAFLDPDRAITSRSNGFESVRDEENGHATLAELSHASQAFLPKGLITFRRHLIDDQDVGVHLGGDGKAKAHHLAGGVGAQSRVDEDRPLRLTLAP